MFVPAGPTILHADADAFFASVEQRDKPRLRGRPVIVGSWVVMAASYEARAHGIHGGMRGTRARRLCPQAVVVEPRWSAYVDASAALFEAFEQVSPTVEGLSLEEAFLDVRGLERILGSPREIAERLRRDVREQVGLAVSVGAARTKLLAKMASRAAKPDGLLVLAPDEELSFLHRLRVEELWGVGAATARRLHGAGITSVAEVAALEESALIAILGRAAGRHLHAVSRNRDPRRVRARRGRRSIGSQSALDRSSHSSAAVDAVLLAVVERVARRMRACGRVARTIVLRLRFADYARATRSRTLAEPTADTHIILGTARSLLAEATPLIERRGLTLIGVTAHALGDGRTGVQLALPFARTRGALDAALDLLRDRYGPTAITRATLLGRGERLSPWSPPGELSRRRRE